MYHAAALLGVGLLARQQARAGAGCGRLGLSAGHPHLLRPAVRDGPERAGTVLGRVVPIGGVLLIAGWLALAWAASRESGRCPGSRQQADDRIV